MPGRFKLLTDEHWSKAHIKAARDAGWEVLRVVDVAELGQGTLDPEVLAYCSQRRYVWATTDQRAQGHITDWINSGRTLPGVIMAVQRHRITPGRLVRFLEKLSAEEAPFAGVIRFVTPAEE
ncbi:MAG: DUF5615 family PIN-like protein [Acidobacteria bacterium]|nr:DUF5615 family PIN-like protein [Acidobacteriota bacterium]